MATRVDRRRFVVAGVCLVAGCTVDSGSIVPPLTPPESLAGVPQRQGSDAIAPSNWWSNFNSPKLDALIERALLANPQLRAARAEASALINSAIDTGAASGVSGTASVNLPIFGSMSSVSSTLRVASNALPFRELSRTRRRAWLQATESMVAVEVLSNAIEIELAGLVIDLDFYLQVASLMQISVRTSRASVDTLQDQFDANEVTRIDLLRAQARLSSMLADDAQNQRNLLTTRASLATAIAGSLDDPLINSLFSGTQVELPQTSFGASISIQSLMERPAVFQQEITYLVRRSELDSAYASLFPTLGVSGQVTASSGSVGWVFSPSLTLPPLSSVRREARRSGALDRVYAAMFSWQDAMIDAASVVEVSQIQIESEWLRLSRTEAAARSLQRVFAESQSLEDSGEVTILSVLEAEEEYLNARVVVAQSRRDILRFYTTLLSSI
jgi:multidrug efflux system outer membrane protein